MGTLSPLFSTIKNWAAEFKRGCTDLEVDPREGRTLQWEWMFVVMEGERQPSVWVILVRIYINEELNDLYSLPSIVRVVKSRRMRWAGHVTRMGEDSGVRRVMVGKPEGKSPLRRPRRR
jgi:hypothetical protein